MNHVMEALLKLYAHYGYRITKELIKYVKSGF